MQIIGCDLHTRQQTLAILDTQTGDVMNKILMHEHGKVREFYSALARPVRVGNEATGLMQWFLNLMEGLGEGLRVDSLASAVRSYYSPRRNPGDTISGPVLCFGGGTFARCRYRLTELRSVRHGRSKRNLMSEPTVTIVIVPRERFSYSRSSLESMYANTHPPFSLIYVDGGSPDHVKRYLQTQAREKGFRLIRTEHYLSPNQARNIGLRLADSRYVVFLDNDVEVAPGWLEALVQSAEETDASVVGPLYCIGQPLHQVIHMAGGEARIQHAQGRRRLHEKHRLCNKRVSDVRPQMRREQCELVEFHCTLVRRAVLQELGPLDEALLSTREHVDLCLTVRAGGGTVWFEPNAVVTYVVPPSFAWSDIPYYLLRWSDMWGQASLRHFDRKWNLDESNGPLASSWLRPHRQVAFGGLRTRLHRMVGQRLGNRLLDALVRFLTREASRKGHNPRSQAAPSDTHIASV